jgi:NADH-quinone oxidoreductase subunit A
LVLAAAVTTQGSLWPLLAYVVLAVGIVALLVGLSWFLGERHREEMTGEPFESGIAPSGFPSGGLSIEFYRVAVFFVIFDVETVFIFAWAIALRDAGWAGYVEMLVFVGVLVAALAYLWRAHALDWGTSRRRWLETRRRGGGA